MDEVNVIQCDFNFLEPFLKNYVTNSSENWYFELFYLKNVTFPSYRYLVCKGLRGNIEAVHEHMFNVNVRINKLKAGAVEDVNEVCYSV